MSAREGPGSGAQPAVAPQRISIVASRRLLLIQSVAHMAAAGALCLAELPAVFAAIMLLLIGASWALQRRPQAVTTLGLGADGQLQTFDAEGRATSARVASQTLVLPFLVVLLWREGNRLRSLTLLSDSMRSADFHSLRLWLRWRAVAVDADAASAPPPSP